MVELAALQPREAAPLDRSYPRSTEVVIDDDHLPGAERSGALGEGVLPSLAFLVVADLVERATPTPRPSACAREEHMNTALLIIDEVGFEP